MNNSNGKNLSSLLMANTLWNVFGKLFSSLFGFFLTYYTIRKIGLENYGLYALINATGGYLSMLDIGAGSAFIKYVSEYNASGLRKKIDSLLSTGVLFYTCFSVAVLSIILLFGNTILSWLKVSVSIKEQGYTILVIYGFVLSFSGLFYPYQAVISGLERFDIMAKINVFSSVLSFVSSIVVLEKGYGLTGLMANNLFMTLITGLIFTYFSHYLLPGLSINPLLAEREMFRKVFSYGLKVQTTRLSSIIASHFEKFIIVRVAGVSWMAIYHIGNSLCEQVRNLPLLITSALFPAFSRLWASDRKSDVRETYLRAVRYLSFIGIAVMSFLAVSAKSTIFLWMGEGYEVAANVTSVLAIGYMINTIMGAVGGNVVCGMGRPDIQMKGAVLNMFLNVALSLILINLFGFPGAAIGTSIAMTVAVFYFIYMLHPLIEVDGRVFFKVLAKFITAAALACIVVLLFSHFQQKPKSRTDAFIDIIRNAIIFFSVYSGFLFIFKPFDYYDRKFFDKSGIFILKWMRIFCQYERDI